MATMKSLTFSPHLNSRLQWTFVLQKRGVHMSSIYRPALIIPPPVKGQKANSEKGSSEAISKSQKLLINNGLIKQSSCMGAYHLLPVALRSLEKLTKLVDTYMQNLQNCQKIQMPTLTSASLWKTTGRLAECEEELLKVADRHSKSFVLSPTHEEAVCDLLKGTPLTYRQLPLRLYQITEKFRDEKRPRFALLRGRQFLMKDLYTFDVDLESAKKTYEDVNQTYGKLLDTLGLNWIKAIGSTGTIGGSFSHEFHVISDIGEDSIYHCNSCNHSFNVDIVEQQEQTLQATATSSGNSVTVSDSSVSCINCGSSSTLSTLTGIEVGHSFLLGTKYTKVLEAQYVNESNMKVPMEMGCYGLGVSRLMAAAIEVKSTETEIRWPVHIAPYLVSIIPPKSGSKEADRGFEVASKLYASLQKIISGDVIYDDRTTQTIGKRLLDTKKLGIPYVIVCGKGVNDPSGPLLEFHDVNASSMSMLDSNMIFKKLYDINSELKK